MTTLLTINQTKFTGKITHSPIKRIFDIIFSAVTLVISSPILLLIALSIKLTSKGPVIYSQERVCRGGQRFFCYKFRTMFQDSEKRLEKLLNANPRVKKEWDETRKIKNDPRVTPLGAFLRRTSLDELPQFFNVLKGDLSVVGPRPVVVEEIETYFGQKAHKLLSVRPGITGLWQVSGRSDLSYAERVLLEESYVDSRNFLLDLKLIIKTIPCMLKAKGAY